MQSNQESIASSVSKSLLPMQSLDALLQSSQVQSNLLASQHFRHSQFQLQAESLQKDHPVLPSPTSSLGGLQFRQKSPNGSPSTLGGNLGQDHGSPQDKAGDKHHRTQDALKNSSSSVIVADELIWQKAWSTKFPSAPTHSYPTLASWVIKRLNNRITGRWTDIATGRFDLEWKETAESWYHQRPRRSCPNDAPHLLHKGLLAAFPNLIETRRETIARQSCVKREFKMPDDVCQQVAAILESIIKNGGVAPSGKESYGNMVSYRRRNDLYSVDDEKRTELRTLRTEDGKVETVRVHPLVPRWPEEYVDGQFSVSSEFMSPSTNPPIITHIDSGKIVSSGKKQLTELHQWASGLESFQSLSGEVRKALFSNCITLLLLLKFAFKSSRASAKQLQDNSKSCYNPGDGSSEVVQKVGKLILDKLVAPLQNLISTDEELDMFMAIILFDPTCETLDDESEKVAQFRQEVCDKLEGILAEKGGKLSDLLLLYPPLCTVRSAMIEHLSLVELIGEASDLRNNARDIMSNLVG